MRAKKRKRKIGIFDVKGPPAPIFSPQKTSIDLNAQIKIVDDDDDDEGILRVVSDTKNFHVSTHKTIIGVFFKIKVS
jgi:hypothetical protein